MQYAGMCYDGPKMGQWIAQPMPYFRIAVPTDNVFHLIQPPDDFDPSVLNVTMFYYHWSRSLHMWCLEY